MESNLNSTQEKYLQQIIFPHYFHQTILPQKCIILSGFPYDEGTRRNGGRVGGAVASKIFREMIQEHQVLLKHYCPVYDTGDISSDLDLETAHIKLNEKHRQILKLGQGKQHRLLVSIGGSNDQSYPNVKALMECYPNNKIGVINLDSHFDVRPLKENKAHSGSPFRQMLQDQLFSKNQSIFIQFACKGNTCSNEHYKYLISKGVKVYWMQKDIRMFDIKKDCRLKTQAAQLFFEIIEKLKKQVDIIFVSFDIDSIGTYWMPGVSAPNVTGGLTNQEALQIMLITGECCQVKLVDFSQFNPAVESNISARMLVEMFGRLIVSFSKQSSD